MSSKLVLLVGFAVLAAVMVGVARITGGNGAKPYQLGTEVLVGYSDYSEGQSGTRTQIGLTVLAVRTGTKEDLEAIGHQDKDVTPYYIDARFVNKGQNAVARNLGLRLEDSRGRLVPQTPIFFFGTGNQAFEPCPEVAEGTLKPGESYESCTLVLVPEGVDVAKVFFLSDNGPDREPELVYWAIE